ncbi:hypothetical protein A0257_11140 [Hymenobacter psoromatis]|nr:hypothetical protein A0257_11140 [Hymenobacter psoromatis]
MLVLLLASCHATDPTTGTTTVSGQVVQYQTTKGVPNAIVQVYHASSGGGYLPVGSGYPADATGHFTFNFDADSKTGYLLLANAPPGYSTDWALAPSLTAGRKNEGLVIPTYAPTWLKLRLINTSHKKQYSISIQGYAGAAIGGQGDFFYDPRDTTLIRTTQAIYYPTSVSWFITGRDGSTSQNYQSINPGPLDTTTVRIPF